MTLHMPDNMAVDEISQMGERATGIEVESLQTDERKWKLVQRSLG